MAPKSKQTKLEEKVAELDKLLRALSASVTDIQDELAATKAKSDELELKLSAEAASDAEFKAQALVLPILGAMTPAKWTALGTGIVTVIGSIISAFQ